MIITLPASGTTARMPRRLDDGPTKDEPSYILHERARTYHWSGEGLLSIKAFFGGRALYNASGGTFGVDDAVYLLLNQGQHYEISIEALRPVESLCVFFSPALVRDVQRVMTSSAARLVDEPWRDDAPPPAFFERTYPHDELVSPILFALRALLKTRQGDPNVLSMHVHDVLMRLFEARTATRYELDALPAVRAATREEIYRRVYRAKDYAAACYDQPVTLNDLARVACLSPTHLLRVFTTVVGQTPHQYLISVRLEHARTLLKQTDLPVSGVCLAVGFQSVGSFSSLFRARVGLSPAAYRRCFR